MTSHRKTVSNRQNARRSTGPTSPAGKAIAAANALKHGAAARLLPDGAGQAKITAMARAFLGAGPAGARRRALAFEAAEAHFLILRLKDARQQAWQAALPVASKNLAKLMRYEAMLSNRRDKALRKLEYRNDTPSQA